MADIASEIVKELRSSAVYNQNVEVAPAIWLRCVIGGSLDIDSPEFFTPILPQTKNGRKANWLISRKY